MVVVRKERKCFEETQRVAKESLNKREREEVESLKRKLAALENELQTKESRWKKNVERLNKTIDSQKREIVELKSTNQHLERMRIEQMKKQNAAAAINSSEAKRGILKVNKSSSTQHLVNLSIITLFRTLPLQHQLTK